MALPKFFPTFQGSMALETPQTLLEWTVDAALEPDIQSYELRRGTTRWPLPGEGELLMTWRAGDAPASHYADFGVEADSLYLYSLIANYSRSPMSGIMDSPVAAPFNPDWNGRAVDVKAHAGDAPLRIAVLVHSAPRSRQTLDMGGRNNLLILDWTSRLIDTEVSLDNMLQAGEDASSLLFAGLLDGSYTGIILTSLRRLVKFTYVPGSATLGGQVLSVNLDDVLPNTGADVRSGTLEFLAGQTTSNPEAIVLLDRRVWPTAPTHRVYRLDPATGAWLSTTDISLLPDLTDLRGIAFDHDADLFWVTSGRRFMSFASADAAPAASLADAYAYEAPEGSGYSPHGNPSMVTVQADGVVFRWDLTGNLATIPLVSDWKLARTWAFSGRDYPSDFDFKTHLYDRLVSERFRRTDHSEVLFSPTTKTVILGTTSQAWTGRLDAPVVPGSFRVYDEDSPSAEGRDLDLTGAITGQVTGTLIHQNGEYSVNFPNPPVGVVRITYQQRLVSGLGDWIARDADTGMFHVERLCRFWGLILDRLVDHRDLTHRLLSPEDCPPLSIEHVAYRAGIDDLDPSLNMDRQRLYLSLYPEVLRRRGTLGAFKLLLKFYGYLLDFTPARIIPSRQLLDSKVVSPSTGYELDYEDGILPFDTFGASFVVNFKLRFRRIADLAIMPAADPTTKFLVRKLEKIKPFNAILTYSQA